MDSKSPATSVNLDPDSSAGQDAAQDVSADPLQDDDGAVYNHVADEILNRDARDTRKLSVIGQTLKLKGDMVTE